MKPLSIILFFSNFLFSNVLIAQDVQEITFKYRCVPTSTNDYSIEITKDRFKLSKTEKIPNRKDRVKKVNSSNYTHSFNTKQKETLDSIIKTNRLNSIGLYQDRITEWGSLWEIEIQQHSITYHIYLPNYN